MGTPTAFANFAMVASVGFVFLFSMLLIIDLSIPAVLTISPCEIPFSVLIRFKLLANFCTSFFIERSITRHCVLCYAL